MASSYSPADWFGTVDINNGIKLSIDFNNSTSGGTGVMVTAAQEALCASVTVGTNISNAKKVFNSSASRTELEVTTSTSHSLAYGDIVTISGLTVPTSSASSIYDDSFTDPNQGYMVVGLGEHDDASENATTKFRVVFSSSEINNAEYGVSSSSTVVIGDFRVALYGIMQGLYNAYVDGRSIPDGFKMSSAQGGYDATSNCYYQSFTVNIKMQGTNARTPSAKLTGINMEND